MTPLYDILTAQPSLDTRQIQPKQMRLALSVPKNNHYRIGDIHKRHFIQTGEVVVNEALTEAAASVENSEQIRRGVLPADFYPPVTNKLYRERERRPDFHTITELAELSRVNRIMRPIWRPWHDRAQSGSLCPAAAP